MLYEIVKIIVSNPPQVEAIYHSLGQAEIGLEQLLRTRKKDLERGIRYEIRVSNRQ
jgi:hypothetical protein